MNPIQQIDQIRLLSETISFVPYNYEYTFAAPQTDRILVQDVLLSVHGAPSFTHPAGLVGVSCNDIHFYVDGIDLTELLLENIRKNIAQADQTIIIQEYTFALNKWLELEEKMGAAYGTPDLIKEKQTVSNLLNTSPIATTLNKLGDIKTGWGGNLHIFNYLYKEISIAPVSLSTIIQNYNSTHPGNALDTGKIQRLTFSSGPCRLYSSGWDPINIPTGSLHCLFEIKVHEPLEDRVTTLEKELESLQDDISEALDDIADRFNNETNKTLTQVNNTIGQNSINISAIQTELINHQKKLDNLTDSTQQILTAIQTI